MKRKFISSLFLTVMLPVAAFGCDIHKNPVKVTEAELNVRMNAGAAVILDRRPAMVLMPEGVKKEEPVVQETEENLSVRLEEEEEYILKKLAMAEAEGEDVKGKALVMQVVLNRVWSDEFPGTVKEVVYQDGEFSPINDGRFDRAEPDDGCQEALEMVKEKLLDDCSMGATYFESRSESTWHSRNLQYLFQYGRHYFYKNRE